MGVARHHYRSPDGNDASHGNVKLALILFYALVLTQSALFLLWFAVARNRWVLAGELKEYLNETEVREFMDGIKLIDRYVTATLDTCIEKGVVSTMNRTLVTFAGELLQSEYSGDHVSAVAVLYVVIKRNERTAGVFNQICASEKFAGRLFQLIRSLLDGRLMETAAKTESPGEEHIIIDTGSGPNGSSLFFLGLLILGEVARDPENRTRIGEAADLVPKIVAPISKGLLEVSGNQKKTVHIVKASLVVVDKLTSGADQTSTKIRSKISEDRRIAENLLWILQRSDGMMISNGAHEMKIPALKILTRLSLVDATGYQFIGVLRDLVRSDQDSRLKIQAARALIARDTDQTTWQLIIQHLVHIISDDNHENRAQTAGLLAQSRAQAAGLLAQICAKSRTDQDRNRLRPVSDALSNVLKVLRDINVQQADATFIYSFLSLALEICDKLGITAEALTRALADFRMDDRAFAGKLMGIVQTLGNNADSACLKVMKAMTKLAAWMMRTNDNYIGYFRQENIIKDLNNGEPAMRDLEMIMVLTGLTDETEAYETYESLVENVRVLVLPQQQR